MEESGLVLVFWWFFFSVGSVPAVKGMLSKTEGTILRQQSKGVLTRLQNISAWYQGDVENITLITFYLQKNLAIIVILEVSV